MSNYNTSPFQWAGGKGKALHHLLPILEKHKAINFVEPFIGAANVSLNFEAEKYIWNDLNKDLVGSYASIFRDPFLYLDLCGVFFAMGYGHYYQLRDRFNSRVDECPESAALFQYLNKHGFNGLCRYNKSGGFNVPIGTVTKTGKNVPTESIKRLYKRHAENTTLHCTDFETIFTVYGNDKGNLIYSDPPYVPLTSDFKYTADGFGKADHELLKKLSKESVATCIISNHWTSYTEELYSDADEVYVFDVQRTISCDGGNRKKVQECVVVYKGE